MGFDFWGLSERITRYKNRKDYFLAKKVGKFEILNRKMDSSKTSALIEKLQEDNFHTWKTKINFVLTIKDLDEVLEQNKPDENDRGYNIWKSNDKKARAIIGLSLSDTILQQVQHAESAKLMFKAICDIFEKHTLLNKLNARRKFFTAQMDDGEKVIAFAARVRQLAETLKSMKVQITTQDMAMTFLSGLPERFDSLISALDALAVDDHDDENKNFTFEFVVSRCEQEERRHGEREKSELEKSETAALIASRKFHTKPTGDCIHCGLHNNSNICYKKFPHLAPPDHRLRKKHEKALIAEEFKAGKSQDIDDIVCLFGKLQ